MKFLSDYDLQAVTFLNHAACTMGINRKKIVDHFPNDDRPGTRWQYEVKLRRAGKTFTFQFYDSIYNYQNDLRPSKYDVLATIEKYDPGEDINDFANMYGYDLFTYEDRQRVNRIYKACKTQYTKLLAFFGSDLMKELQEIQ